MSKSTWLAGALFIALVGAPVWVANAKDEKPAAPNGDAKAGAEPEHGKGESPGKGEAHAKGDGDHGHGHGHEPEGVITAKKQDLDLAVFTLVTFGVVLFVLGKYAWGPIMEGLEKREQYVMQQRVEAENARMKSEKLLADYEGKLARAQDEVRAIVAEARRDGEHTKAELIAAAQKEMDAMRTRATVDIERAKSAALDELFGYLSKSVAEATAQVVGRSMTGDDQTRLVRETLESMSKKA